MESSTYSDLELIISPVSEGVYSVTGSAEGGDPSGQLLLPDDLEQRIEAFEKNMLKGIVRGVRDFSETTAKAIEQEDLELGKTLFNLLFSSERRRVLDRSLYRAKQENKGLRVVLRLKDARLVAIPWELAVDPDTNMPLAASKDTPVVRYTDQLEDRPQNLRVAPPVRVLGVAAKPNGLEELDIPHEKERLERALETLTSSGKVELTWLDQPTRETLLNKLNSAPWHVLHFIGHGTARGKAGIIICDPQGQADILDGEDLRWLLNDQNFLRLVVLNSCEGARGGSQIFSSLAAQLMQIGIPAVLAMQYPITDQAAKTLSAELYQSLTAGEPVDAAVSRARVAIKTSSQGSAEWATPVLYMRSSDGMLFDVAGVNSTSATAASPPPPVVTQQAVPLQAQGVSSAVQTPTVRSGQVSRPARRGLPLWGWLALSVAALILLFVLFNQSPASPPSTESAATPLPSQTPSASTENTAATTSLPSQAPSASTGNAAIQMPSGTWIGNAEGQQGEFRVKLTLPNSCEINGNCGQLVISNPYCVGRIKLLSSANGMLHFDVFRFSDDSATECVEEDGEYFRIVDGSTLQYTTDYDNTINATLKQP